MAELKTKQNNFSVREFLNGVKDERKRKDSFELLKIFEEATGEKGKMWGSSIVGFGKYHYKSSRSKQEGDWMLSGFSPRKQAISIYVMSGFQGYSDLLKKLGKHKLSSGCCLYINKLEDVDKKILKKLIRDSSREVLKKSSC